MVSCLHAAWPLAFCGFLCVSASSTDLMRREFQKALHLDPEGDLIQERSTRRHANGACMGNYTFAWGTDLTNNCTSPGHFPIEEQKLCMRAAEEGGFATIPNRFKISQSWEDRRPTGCFMQPCAESAKGCLFFNEAQLTPTSIDAGSIVCARPRYLFGAPAGANATANATAASTVAATAAPTEAPSLLEQDPANVTAATNTNSTATSTFYAQIVLPDTGCPPEYTAIQTSEECHSAGDCAGERLGAVFDVQQDPHPDRDTYPPGCSLHPTDGKVYFNGRADAIAPVGKPICVSAESFVVDRVVADGHNLTSNAIVRETATAADPTPAPAPSTLMSRVAKR